MTHDTTALLPKSVCLCLLLSLLLGLLHPMEIRHSLSRMPASWCWNAPDLGVLPSKEGNARFMQIFSWLLKTGSLLVLGLCLAGGELVRAGQTSALPVVTLPAELPPRTAPSELDPELHAFLARAQRLSWTVGGTLETGRAIQIQDTSGRVNGRDAHGQIQTPIPNSTYVPSPPFKVAGEGGFAGTLP